MNRNDTYFITTPIYYPNAKPHLGTLYSTLLADIFARWHRLLGKDVVFLTGLDEHGQKIQEAALAKELPCQEFVDQMAQPFLKTWKDYGLKYDNFIRTSSDSHAKAVTKLFLDLISKDMIYNALYEEFYCVPCETFVSVADTKPLDGEVVCTTCLRPAKKIVEENYFFRLSVFQEKLLQFYESNPNFIEPSSRMNEVITFVKSGLKDLSITRKSVKWGIAFPGDESQTIYVWGDALTNYISAIGYESDAEMFKRFWPANVHVMAKDIVRFHAVYWPAILMAAGLELPKKLVVHGYIMVNNQKMSKSLGNAIDPEELLKNYGKDAVRYYLAKQMAITQDGSFDLEELKNCYNADLANNFGNLVSRVTTLALKNNYNEIPLQNPLDLDCKELLAEALKSLNRFFEHMSNYHLHMALSEVMDICSKVNILIHKKEPWRVVKTDLNLFREVIGCSAQVVNLVGRLLFVVVPDKIQIVQQALHAVKNVNLSDVLQKQDQWQVELKVQALDQVVFPRLETLTEKPPMKDPIPATNLTPEVESFISFDDLAKVKLAIGKVVFAEAVAKSSKLLRLEVDFGVFGKRQVVSGIAESYHPEKLIGQKAIFVINLAPRKIMGLESQAMILAAKDGTNFSICQPENGLVLEGTLLS